MLAAAEARRDRLMRTRREHPVTSMPYGLAIGCTLARELHGLIVSSANNDIITDRVRQVWGAFVREEFVERNDDSWLEDIARDCGLFAGLELHELMKKKAQPQPHFWVHQLITQPLSVLPLITNDHHHNTLFLVCKVPKLGRSKTRLGKTLGMQLALDFSQACVFDLMERIASSSSCWHRLVVLFFPAEEDCEFAQWLRSELPPSVMARWELQPFATQLPCSSSSSRLTGLGVGLAAALASCSADGGEGMVCFIGMDSPHLSSALLDRAARQSTICAARDGGYTLLSLQATTTTSQAAAESAFSDISWSTELTFCMQLRALHRAGFSQVVRVDDELMFDVDDERDLRELASRRSEFELGRRVSGVLKRSFG